MGACLGRTTFDAPWAFVFVRKYAQNLGMEEQGQILQYNSISRFGSQLNSKGLASADKRNSLKQKIKTNEAAKLL